MSFQAMVDADVTGAVAVDVGKTVVAVAVTDAYRHRLLGPVEFEMTGRGLEGVLALIGSRMGRMFRCKSASRPQCITSGLCGALLFGLQALRRI